MDGNRKLEVRRLGYRPLPSQILFLKLEGTFKGFAGPVGSGKSQALCQEAIRLSYVNAGLTGLLGAPTYQMLRDTAQRTLLDILDSRDIPYEMNKSENYLVFKDTNSTVLFRAVEEFERLRGTNLAWFGLDELTYTPEEAWDRLAARLRDSRATKRCGFAVWTPKGHDWVWRRFVHDKTEGYAVVHAEPYENRHVAESYYKDLERILDKRQFKQEVLGKYLNADATRVYSAFDANEHVRTVELDNALPLRWAMDFNIDPMCSVVAQIKGDQVAVLDEIFLKPGTTTMACEEFLNRFGSHKDVVLYGDAAGNQRQTAGGDTDFKTVEQYFQINTTLKVHSRISASNPPVRARISNTNRMLRDLHNEVKLKIDPRCKELIFDMEEVSYDSTTCEIDKRKDRDRTHLSDALGYMLWEEFAPKQKIGEQQRRLV
jgi:hypothetical protein